MTYHQELATKVALEALGATVGIRHRQLAHREKTYLRIKAGSGHTTWSFIIMPKIRENFPDAYLTSGGFWGDKLEVTVVLEK